MRRFASLATPNSVAVNNPGSLYAPPPAPLINVPSAAPSTAAMPIADPPSIVEASGGVPWGMIAMIVGIIVVVIVVVILVVNGASGGHDSPSDDMVRAAFKDYVQVYTTNGVSLDDAKEMAMAQMREAVANWKVFGEETFTMHRPSSESVRKMLEEQSRQRQILMEEQTQQYHRPPPQQYAPPPQVGNQYRDYGLTQPDNTELAIQPNIDPHTGNPIAKTAQQPQPQQQQLPMTPDEGAVYHQAQPLVPQPFAEDDYVAVGNPSGPWSSRL